MSVASLQREIACYPVGMSGEYIQKNLHRVPKTTVVDRVKYIVTHCTKKRVLSLGCTGQLQKEIDAVTERCYGIDCEPQDREWFYQMDLDDFEEFPKFDVDLIVCGEVLEHLSNPGRVLKALREYQRPVIVTAPNAFGEALSYWIHRGLENVNKEHVAHYSYWTLYELVNRQGFTLVEWFWYTGKPLTAEGLIFWLN